jgi:DNA primase
MLVSNGDKGYGAYCFRCGTKHFEPHGMFSIDDLKRRRFELDYSSTTTIKLPKDFTTEIPPREAVWLYKWGVSARLAELYGIGYSATMRRIVIPIMQDGELVGTIARSTIGEKPKYLERVNAGVVFSSKPDLVLPAKTDTGGSSLPDLVITEDVVSGIRVGRITQAVAILGTSIDTRQILGCLRSSPRSVAVWLDNDKAGRQGSATVYRALSLQGLNVSVLFTGKDPKAYSNSELRSLLDRSSSAPHNAEAG